MNESIQAVIFDMDGTLIDTEKYYRKCWPEAFAAFGYTMTDEQVLAIRSLGRPFAPRQFREWFGEDLDYEAVRNRRKELVAACIARHGIETKPGAATLLQLLKQKGILTAVATATDLTRTEAYLKQVGLYEYFDRLISATMVPEGKPSPYVYAYACEQIGVAPEHCFAVEDSPNGVLSAYRAGCKVIMVPDATEPDEALRSCLFACEKSLAEIGKYFA